MPLADRRAPFAKDAPAAAAWIEAEEDRRADSRTVDAVVTIAVRWEGSPVAPLAELRDWLVDNLPPDLPPDAGPPIVRGLISESGSPVRDISFRTRTLPYLAFDEAGVAFISHARADDGTKLADLLASAEVVSKRTGWSTFAAVMHVLTDALPAGAVQVGSQSRWNSAGTAELRLTISDPLHTPVAEVERAYIDARRELPNLAPGTQRGVPNPRAERLVRFVEQSPEKSWPARQQRWTADHPEDRYRTPDAMRSAYGRATKRRSTNRG